MSIKEEMFNYQIGARKWDFFLKSLFESYLIKITK